MQNDAAEYNTYFRAHYLEVLRYVERRVASPEDAAELTADVFRIAWQGFDPGGQHNRGWLFGISRNVVLEHYRKTGRRKAATQRYEMEFSSQMESSFEDNNEHPVLEALEQLPEPAQEILRLRYWDGLQVTEIAQALGVSQVTARVRLHRARARIKPLISAHTRQEG